MTHEQIIAEIEQAHNLIIQWKALGKNEGIALLFDVKHVVGNEGIGMQQQVLPMYFSGEIMEPLSQTIQLIIKKHAKLFEAGLFQDLMSLIAEDQKALLL